MKATIQPQVLTDGSIVYDVVQNGEVIHSPETEREAIGICDRINSKHHTPGPWRVGNAGTAVFGPPNGNPSPETIATDLKRGDARLIAAAPELLDALKSIMQSFVHIPGDDKGNKVRTEIFKHCENMRRAAAMARAIIAKA